MKNKMIIAIIALYAVISVTVHIVSGHRVSEVSKELEYAQSELVSVKEKYEIEKTKVETFSKDLNATHSELDEANKTINDLNKTIVDLKSEEYKLVYLGNYKITHYCDERYPHICGGNGMTASGKPTEIGWSAAADWDVIPKGTIIYVQGVGWREVQDVGGGVNGDHIDVLVEKHTEAMTLGTKHKGVWMLIKKS